MKYKKYVCIKNAYMDDDDGSLWARKGYIYLIKNIGGEKDTQYYLKEDHDDEPHWFNKKLIKKHFMKIKGERYGESES